MPHWEVPLAETNTGTWTEVWPHPEKEEAAELEARNLYLEYVHRMQ